MKKIKLIIATLLVCLSVTAQRGKSDQVNAMKVAFITKELNLTTGEAEKFWPLYNAYEERQKALRRNKISGYLNRASAEELNKMSDKEASNILAQIEGTEMEIFEHKKKFMTQLKTVIPPAKILKLRKAEEDFSRRLLKQYRQRTKKN